MNNLFHACHKNKISQNQEMRACHYDTSKNSGISTNTISQNQVMLARQHDNSKKWYKYQCASATYGTKIYKQKIVNPSHSTKTNSPLTK